MLDAQCSNKTQRVSLLEALDVVALDSTMNTFELVCLCYTYYNHSLIRFGAGVVQVVKLVVHRW